MKTVIPNPSGHAKGMGMIEYCNPARSSVVA